MALNAGSYVVPASASASSSSSKATEEGWLDAEAAEARLFSERSTDREAGEASEVPLRLSQRKGVADHPRKVTGHRCEEFRHLNRACTSCCTHTCHTQKCL